MFNFHFRLVGKYLPCRLKEVVRKSIQHYSVRNMDKSPTKKRKHVDDSSENDDTSDTKQKKIVKLSPPPACSASFSTELTKKLTPAEKLAKYKNDKKEDFEYFYREASPFSQFHPAKFSVDGVNYLCAEQYMMHQKALVFKDKEIAEQIMKATKPLEMKKLGRKVHNFVPAKWSSMSVDVVKKGNIAKFSQNKHLKEQLLSTHPKILVEASPRDCLWGIGLSKENKKSWSRATWRGRNLLGYALTDVRKELMDETS